MSYIYDKYVHAFSDKGALVVRYLSIFNLNVLSLWLLLFSTKYFYQLSCKLIDFKSPLFTQVYTPASFDIHEELIIGYYGFIPSFLMPFFIKKLHSAVRVPILDIIFKYCIYIGISCIAMTVFRYSIGYFIFGAREYLIREPHPGKIFLLNDFLAVVLQIITLLERFFRIPITLFSSGGDKGGMYLVIFEALRWLAVYVRIEIFEFKALANQYFLRVFLILSRVVRIIFFSIRVLKDRYTLGKFYKKERDIFSNVLAIMTVFTDYINRLSGIGIQKRISLDFEGEEAIKNSYFFFRDIKGTFINTMGVFIAQITGYLCAQTSNTKVLMSALFKLFIFQIPIQLLVIFALALQYSMSLKITIHFSLYFVSRLFNYSSLVIFVYAHYKQAFRNILPLISVPLFFLFEKAIYGLVLEELLRLNICFNILNGLLSYAFLSIKL